MKPNNLPRACVFCGASKNISREHVIPDWVQKVAPRLSDTYTHMAYQFSEPSHKNLFIGIKPRYKKGNLGNRTLFQVCSDCNNGWMKQIQDQTVETLKPLIKGIWEQLKAEDAAKIAVWSAMTASVIACSFPDIMGVTTKDRKLLLNTLKVPPHWSVWIGRASGFSEPVYSNRVSTAFRPLFGEIHPAEANTNVTTIVIGQLIVHIISAPFDDIVPDAIDYGRFMGIFPVHPWRVDCDLDWRWIPVLFSASAEFDRVKNDFFFRGSVN